ncbi:response regulator [bacterium]|nr:MAG: response regulator [bacterium]
MRRLKFSLLLIEDSEVDYLILSELLTEIETIDIEVEWMPDYEQALRSLPHARHDVCLLDHNLGKRTGLELLQGLAGQCDVPIIVLTGSENYHIDAAAMAAGATDYLVKGNLTPSQLERSIRYAIQHKSSERSLIQAQRLTQSIVDSLPDKIAVLNNQGVIVAVNQAWTALSPDNCFPGAGDSVGVDLLSKFTEILEPEMQVIGEGIRGAIQSGAVNGDRLYSRQFPCTHHAQQQWFELNVSHLKGSNPPLVMLALENITDRHQNEEHLRVSEANMIQAQEMASLGSWEYIQMSPNGTSARFWSDETFRILGYLPHEVDPTFENFLRVIHPDDRDSFTNYLEHYKDSQTSFVIDHRLLRDDGSVRYVQERVARVTDALGTTIKWVGTVQDVTERTREEAQFRFQQTLLEAQSEESLDGILVVSPTGQVLSCNQNFLRLWSLPQKVMDDRDGETIVKAIYEKLGNPEQFLATVHYLYGHTQERSHDEVELLDGRVLERHSSPVADSDGFYYGRVWYFRDITERKRAERELRDSEARFKGIVSNVPGLVYQFVSKPDGTVEFPFISQGSVELVGLKPEEIRNNADLLMGLTYVDDLESFSQSIEKAVSRKEPWHWEGRQQLASGEVKWVQGVSHPRQLEDGSTLWDGLLIDITKRKEAEEERDRFFTLSIDMLAVVGRDSRLKRFNGAFEKTLGYSDEVLRSTPLLDFVHPDDLQETITHMGNFETGTADVDFTNRNICHDGSIKWLSWHAVLFEGLFYVVAHDITPMVKADSALRQANEDLEQRVVVRTKELATANEELRVENVERQMATSALRDLAEAYRIAKEQSEVANRAKSEFLSRMSHELRTPLNAILGFGEILQGAALGSEEKEHVGQIIHGGWHLLDLINEILDISRVETGALDLSLEPVSLNDIINESCALVKPLAAQRNVRLDTGAISNRPYFVMADRQRLKQVIINLLSNAIKYNRVNGQVALHCDSTPNGRLRIAVQDTGVGISSEDKKKLFVPFERLNTMESAVEGTGLGLALSKHLVTAMGGQIEVESTIGTGSTFLIELAETNADEKPVTGGKEKKSLSGEVLSRDLVVPDRSHLVLSIEDNSANQLLLQQILARHPEVALMSASNGKRGLGLAIGHRPSLILLNLNLPDISGEEVLGHLKRDVITKDIPVIVVSADAIPLRAERLLTAGAHAYLTKPYNAEQLLAAIEAALQVPQPELLSTSNAISSPSVAEMPMLPQPESSPEFRPLRILVAEDNLVNQKVISLQLQKLGHRPCVCNNGEIVVEEWKKGHYDLILMDCQMPIKDGYTATREIRLLEDGKKHIPIIALTANAMAEDRERSLAAGMDGHLSKPLKRDELHSVLQNIRR